jgi:hypothetical protein
MFQKKRLTRRKSRKRRRKKEISSHLWETCRGRRLSSLRKCNGTTRLAREREERLTPTPTPKTYLVLSRPRPPLCSDLLEREEICLRERVPSTPPQSPKSQVTHETRTRL